MRTAYVVLSHTEGEHTARLVHAILRSSGDAAVFIAHDARRAPAPVIDDERVRVWAHGRSTDWGSWELLQVSLDAMAWARDTCNPDLVVLVSGQCYPARPLHEWERDLIAAGGWQGTATPLSYAPVWGRRHGTGDQDLTRYTYRWFRVRQIDRILRSGRLTARVLVGLAHRIEPVLSLRMVGRGRGAHVGLRRTGSTSPRGEIIYQGSQWLAVDRRLLDVVLAKLAEGTTLRRFYVRSIIPDESAIQTVLARLQPPTVPVPTSFSVWEPDRDETRTLTLVDLDAIRLSSSPFCRKVEGQRSGSLMDALDRLNGVA